MCGTELLSSDKNVNYGGRRKNFVSLRYVWSSENFPDGPSFLHSQKNFVLCLSILDIFYTDLIEGVSDESNSS